VSDLNLDDVDPHALVDALASVLRRAAGDLVIAHHIANALGAPTEWFTNVAVICTDFAHELSPATKENP